MKPTIVFALAALMVVIAAAPALAQTASSPGEHHPAAPAAATPSTPAPGASGSSPHGSGAGTMPMAMCQEMMRGGMAEGGTTGGMMGGGMMGMPMMGGAGAMDRKAMGQMLEMRADMMKAMADVMIKHARRMQQPPTK